VGRHATEVGRSVFNTFVKKVCMYVCIYETAILPHCEVVLFLSLLFSLSALRNSIPFCS
jgi:hypothetical protein